MKSRQIESTEEDYYNQEESQNLIRKVRSEYISNLLTCIISITLLILINIIYFMFLWNASTHPKLLFQTSNTNKSIFDVIFLNLSLNWLFFSMSTYFIMYLLRIAFFKFTDSFIKYLENELEKLDLKLQKRHISEKAFFVMNSFAILILGLIDLKIINFDLISNSQFFEFLLIFYLAICIIIPIIFHFFFNNLRVKLKKNYHINFKINYPILKRKRYPMIDIYLSSNYLKLKSNKTKLFLYKKISEDSWLIKSKTYLDDSMRKKNPFLSFKAYSTQDDFQHEFLNIAEAIKEWDKWEDYERVLRRRLELEIARNRYRILVFSTCLENRYRCN